MHIHPPLAVRTQCVAPPYGGHLAGTNVMLWQRWVQLVDTPFISSVRSTCVPATLRVVGSAIAVASESLTIGGDAIVGLILSAVVPRPTVPVFAGTGCPRRGHPIEQLSHESTHSPAIGGAHAVCSATVWRSPSWHECNDVLALGSTKCNTSFIILDVRSTYAPVTLCVIGGGSDSIVCLALHAHALALQSRCSHCA